LAPADFHFCGPSGEKQEGSMFKKTPEAARALGVPYWRLSDAIRRGALTPPQKDSSGDYVWGPDDIERARAALAIDRRKNRGVHVCGVANGN
jgi:hypothetical protein